MTPNPSFELQTLPKDHLIDVHRRIDGSEDIPLVAGLRRGQALCSVLRVMAGAEGLFGGVRSGGLNH
jgi:hypothetical protein